MATVLMIDADKRHAERYNAAVSPLGHNLIRVEKLKEAYTLCAETKYDLVLAVEGGFTPDEGWLTPFLSGSTPIRVAAVIERSNSTLHRLLRQQGVELCLSGRDAPQRLANLLRQIDENKLPPGKTVSPADFDIFGSSPLLHQAFDRLCGYARFDGNVLLAGSTGTGKELFAQALHRMSPRNHGPLVTVDCASLPETLVESVIFGYDKGAFTGANANKDGLVKLADQGTLFLDEVGEMPLHVQKKFLRVLQERRFLPVGGGKEVRSDFRVIAATNRNLGDMVAAGKFREDLYYRLSILFLELPSLSQRGEDVLLIATKRLDKLCDAAGQPRKNFSENVKTALLSYEWPGNVRELINAIESAYTQAWDNPLLQTEHLPSYIQNWLNARHSVQHSNGGTGGVFVERRTQRQSRRKSDKALPAPSLPQQAETAENVPSYREARRRVLEHFEREYLRTLHTACRADISEACSLSRLSRPRLYELYRKYNILATKPS